jgi:hypothetical protein
MIWKLTYFYSSAVYPVPVHTGTGKFFYKINTLLVPNNIYFVQLWITGELFEAT